jgi:hypothetical protein
MSMIYCHKHDKHYDSDYDTDCVECENEATEVDHCVVCGCSKENDEYVSCPAHSFGEVKQK